jgi:thiol-disulfide isomerase/thioredoxin
MIAIAMAFAASGHAETRPQTKAKTGTVWLVYFLSSDCVKCEHVKKLIDGLKAKYPVKTKSFDIDQKANNELMQRLQSIHSDRKFAVPLVMVGETVLMGEKEISAKLEGAVRKFAKSGGARVPYLGQAPDGKSASASDRACTKCNERGRPPEITDELKRLRRFIDRWL